MTSACARRARRTQPNHRAQRSSVLKATSFSQFVVSPLDARLQHRLRVVPGRRDRLLEPLEMQPREGGLGLVRERAVSVVSDDLVRVQQPAQDPQPEGFLVLGGGDKFDRVAVTDHGARVDQRDEGRPDVPTRRTASLPLGLLALEQARGRQSVHQFVESRAWPDQQFTAGQGPHDGQDLLVERGHRPRRRSVMDWRSCMAGRS